MSLKVLFHTRPQGYCARVRKGIVYTNARVLHDCAQRHYVHVRKDVARTSARVLRARPQRCHGLDYYWKICAWEFEPMGRSGRGGTNYKKVSWLLHICLPCKFGLVHVGQGHSNILEHSWFSHFINFPEPPCGHMTLLANIRALLITLITHHKWPMISWNWGIIVSLLGWSFAYLGEVREGCLHIFKLGTYLLTDLLTDWLTDWLTYWTGLCI